MLKPAFIDLSHHNTVPESLVPAKESGIIGVIHKATEGMSYVDPKLDARWHLAQAAGMLWGVYHFIRPGSVDPQVEHFLNTVMDSDDDTLFALDWEDGGVSLDQAVDFMQQVERITGHSPVIYSGHILKEALGGKPDARISRYRLWIAQYASAPTLPPGWSKFWGWQYSEGGDVPGITPPTDVNAYDGTADELRADWSGAIGDEPAPAPEGPIEITVMVPPGVKVNVVTTKG